MRFARLLSMSVLLGPVGFLSGCGASEGDNPADCSDTKDNDGDGFVDCLDGGCASQEICNRITVPIPDGGTGGGGTGSGTGTGTGTGGSGGSGTTITGYYPDLEITAFTPAPTTGTAYSYILVTYQVYNAGYAYSSATTIDIRFSVDGYYDATDLLLCSDYVPAIYGGGVYNGQVGCTLPGTYAAGSYALVGMVDPSQVLTELIEGNNTSAAAITMY